MADTDEDLYAILGVEATATQNELSRAYRQKSLKVHPDRVSLQLTATLEER